MDKMLDLIAYYRIQNNFICFKVIIYHAIHQNFICDDCWDGNCGVKRLCAGRNID